MTEHVVRIAMWSGPRNISTAMMRSWSSRDDTVVCDEPLYAYYLKATGLAHPGAAEVITHHECNPERVIAQLLGPLPDGKQVYYQKHMAHHLLPGLDISWVHQLTNCFLVREPREMLLSLLRVLEKPGIDATGLPQQVRLFESLADETGQPPLVLDARDVLENPRGVLHALCDRVDVPFDEAMLHWEPGPRATDGIWARHWYDSVYQSTTFAPYTPRAGSLDDAHAALCRACDILYEKLYQHRITA